MKSSATSWTDHTFNPWVGCSKVSPGCDHCYAETLMDKRFKRVSWGPGNERQRTSPKTWREPIQWNREAIEAGRSAAVFCASLADVFDAAAPDAWRHDLFALIDQTPALDWLLLTKRPPAARNFINGLYRTTRWGRRRIPNLFLGVSVENQACANRRIPALLETPAAGYFISAEPLLGPVVIATVPIDLYLWTERRVQWVIAGGESGPGARPAKIEWFRSLRDECAAHGVAFHFKQWGAFGQVFPDSDRLTPLLGKSQHYSRVLDGHIHEARHPLLNLPIPSTANSA